MSKAKDAAHAIHGCAAFTVPGYKTRRRINQHLTRYIFDDVSALDVFTAGRYVARDGSGVRLVGTHGANQRGV